MYIELVDKDTKKYYSYKKMNRVQLFSQPMMNFHDNLLLLGLSLIA